ncbi:hypothetical protein QYF61_000719 [Mycteria americana]|uniref:Uncharacterized protein n=1 Tax=Mycteria americana TaxID=33587 RepID=A0AAN7PNA0_MYCAM|nr:hypothetical protein QYF61_000719 [Mycteria americana]
MGDPCWSSTFLKDCTPWKGPTLDQFVKNCSPWEGLALEKFMEDCLLWEGPHAGAGEEGEESSSCGGRSGRDKLRGSDRVALVGTWHPARVNPPQTDSEDLVDLPHSYYFPHRFILLKYVKEGASSYHGFTDAATQRTEETSPLHKASFQLGDPQHILVPEVFAPWVQDSTLVELYEVPASPFSSISRPLWMAAQPSGISATPPSFVSSVNLLKVHSAPTSRSLMKMLNRTEPSTDSWGTLLVTGLQLDCLPLITTLRTQPVSPFSIQLLIQPIFHQLLYEDLMGDSVKGLAEVQVDRIYCSPLIYQASHFIIEGYQIGMTFAFLQSAPDYHDHSKIIKSSVTILSASSLSTHGLIPWNSSKQIPEKAKIQACDLAFCPAPSSCDPELHHQVAYKHALSVQMHSADLHLNGKRFFNLQPQSPGVGGGTSTDY